MSWRCRGSAAHRSLRNIPADVLKSEAYRGAITLPSFKQYSPRGVRRAREKANLVPLCKQGKGASMAPQSGGPRRSAPHTLRRFRRRPARFVPGHHQLRAAACYRSGADAPGWRPRLPRWPGRQDLRAYVPPTAQSHLFPSTLRTILPAWPATVFCTAPVLFAPLRTLPFQLAWITGRNNGCKSHLMSDIATASPGGWFSAHQYNRDCRFGERKARPVGPVAGLVYTSSVPMPRSRTPYLLTIPDTGRLYE